MKAYLFATATALGLSSHAASAQDAGPGLTQEAVKGVYARSKEQCAAIKKDINAFMDTGESILTSKGTQSVEFHCEFVQWLPSKMTAGAVVTVLCEEPDHGYPEMWALMRRGENEVEVTIMPDPASGQGGEGEENAEGGEEGEASGTLAGLYQLCEGVAAP